MKQIRSLLALVFLLIATGRASADFAPAQVVICNICGSVALMQPVFNGAAVSGWTLPSGWAELIVPEAADGKNYPSNTLARIHICTPQDTAHAAARVKAAALPAAQVQLK
jgi:acyl dehydratase